MLETVLAVVGLLLFVGSYALYEWTQSVIHPHRHYTVPMRDHVPPPIGRHGHE